MRLAQSELQTPLITIQRGTIGFATYETEGFFVALNSWSNFKFKNHDSDGFLLGFEANLIV